MRSAWIRFGIVLAALWLLTVSSYTIYEWQAPFYKKSVFFAVIPHPELPRIHGAIFVGTPFLVERFVATVVIPLAILWVLLLAAPATRWVRGGAKTCQAVQGGRRTAIALTPMNMDPTTQAAHKPSDIWLMKIWIYAILPIFPLAILGFSFFGEGSRGSLNEEQFIFVAICVALIYGLHKKQKWAWYLNWMGILALAAIPLKFGAIGGALGGLWIGWNYSIWNRLEQSFA